MMFRAAGIPTPGGKLVSRMAAAKEHVLERPYVLKPVNEGSSVGVFIVTKEHEHPPQELTRADWEFGEMRAGGAVHPRQGTDLRGDGRQGAGRDRGAAHRAVLRL